MQQWAAFVQGRPPEHPTQDPDVLRLKLFGAEDFVWVVGAVVAAQAHGAVGLAVQVANAQDAVAFDRVDFTVDDLCEAAVNGEDGAVLDEFFHAVADHVYANGLCRINVQEFEVMSGQAYALAGYFHDTGLLGVGVGGDFFIKRNFNVRCLNEVVVSFLKEGLKYPPIFEALAA